MEIPDLEAKTVSYKVQVGGTRLRKHHTFRAAKFVVAVQGRGQGGEHVGFSEVSKKGDLQPIFSPLFELSFPDAKTSLLRVTLLDEKEAGDVIGWADVSILQLLQAREGGRVEVQLQHTNPKLNKKLQQHGEALWFVASVDKEDEEDLARLLGGAGGGGQDQGGDDEDVPVLEEAERLAGGRGGAGSAPPTPQDSPKSPQEEADDRKRGFSGVHQGKAGSPFSASSEV